MKEIQSILAATDFSPGGRQAADRVALLCTDTGVRNASLLHVLEQSWVDGIRRFIKQPADLEASVLSDASQALTEVAAEVQARWDVALTPVVRAGKVTEVLLAESTDHDLLALGALGSHPIRELTIGTTAKRLLRQARQPILVVKRAPETPYRRVVVAVDFSAHSQRALAWANTIAPHAELHLVHALETPLEGQMHYAGVSKEVIDEYRVNAREDAEVQMKQFIGQSGLDAARLRPSITHGNHVPSALVAQGRDVDADLVVVGKHGRSLTQDLLMGSVTLHLLAESPWDILVTQ